MKVNELLPEARIWVRRTSDALDSEILQTISACIKDLERVGIPNPDVGDPLVQQAIKLYVKSEFGFGDEDGKFRDRYDRLRDSMSLSGDYNHKMGG